MDELIRQWSGESVVVSYDKPTDTWMFIAIHDTTLGPALGGCRLHQYDTPADGLLDAMRLAEGMTYKWAVIGFPMGGGKSVLAVSEQPHGNERRGLFHRFGRIIDSLRGLYSTGQDLGTTPQDMSTLGEVTPFVHGASRDGKPGIDPGPFTALGVFCGIQAALEHVYATRELAGRSVLIQGAGDVGVPLSRMVAEGGGRVLLSDVRVKQVEALAKELDAEMVEPHLVYATACDVYAPCAVGATLNAGSIRQLACRIVAGSANNQLAEPSDADRLHERRILYAPDYVVNAGGATALPLLDRGTSTDEVRQRIRGIGDVLRDIFREARDRKESPFHAAKRRAERALKAGRTT